MKSLICISTEHNHLLRDWHRKVDEFLNDSRYTLVTIDTATIEKEIVRSAYFILNAEEDF